MSTKFNLPMIAQLDRADLQKLHETNDFQVALSAYARERDWKVQYFRKSAVEGKNDNWVGIGPKGWPDLFLTRGSVGYAWELKSETGPTTVEQRAWLQALDGITVESGLWRPRDAAEIQERLG